MVQKRKATAVYRGSAGRERADEELAKQKARAEARKEQGHMPFRFRVGVGETTQFVVLDDAPDFFRHEHNLKNPQTGYWDIYTGCTKEWDNCPVCEASNKDSYYAMYLTVLDFTEFKTKDGTKHEFSRKLLVVKPAQQKKFIRAYNKAEKDGLTLRGAVFEVTRDGDKDSSIGNDIEFIEYMEEEDLSTYVRSWKDKDGKKQTEDCSVPYDYDELFEEPDSDKLRALVGGEPAIGSRQFERKAHGRRGQDDDDGDDGDYQKADKSDRMKTRSRRAAPDDDDDDGGDTPPARGSRRAARDTEEPPARGSRRTRARDTEDADDDDTPPARGSRRTARSAPADDDDDDTPPPGTGRRLPVRGRR